MYSANFEHMRVTGEFDSSWLSSLNHVQAEKQSKWLFHMHTHDNLLEISYVISGKGTLYCSGKFYELLAGDIVIKNPGIQHAESSDAKNPIEQACLLIDGLSMHNEFPLGNLPPVVHAKKHRQLLDALINEILHETRRQNLEYANYMLRTILYVCRDEVKNTVSEKERVEKGDLIEQIRAYLDVNFAADISLNDIAEKFHISMYHLARQFKKYTGFTINDYLVSCRIGESQRRLIYKSDSINEIARKSGFHSIAYFYACFRKKVGCTPAEYRLFYDRKTDSHSANLN